jgi:hypothetical protein
MSCQHLPTPGLTVRSRSGETQQNICKECGIQIVRIKEDNIWSVWETRLAAMAVKDFRFNQTTKG